MTRKAAAIWYQIIGLLGSMALSSFVAAMIYMTADKELIWLPLVLMGIGIVYSLGAIAYIVFGKDTKPNERGS